jgi:hypothetical protein
MILFQKQSQFLVTTKNIDVILILMNFQLAHALSVFSQHARGPSCAKYIIDLQKECDDHWHDGRQMCEVLSLTGNPCTQPLHMAIEEEEPCETALLKSV